MKQIAEINSVLFTIFGTGILGILAGIYKQVKKRLDFRNETYKLINNHDKILTERTKLLEEQSIQVNFLKEGLLSLIRHNLKTGYDKAFNRGYTTQEEFDIIAESYSSYKALGGNGKGEEIYEKYKRLKIKGD